MLSGHVYFTGGHFNFICIYFKDYYWNILCLNVVICNISRKIKHDSADPIPISQCFELLDDRAKDFLKQKPDLMKIRNEAVEYCQDTNNILIMCEELENRNNKVMKVVDERLGDLEKQTLETSSIFP